MLTHGHGGSQKEYNEAIKAFFLLSTVAAGVGHREDISKVDIPDCPVV